MKVEPCLLCTYQNTNSMKLVPLMSLRTLSKLPCISSVDDNFPITIQHSSSIWPTYPYRYPWVKPQRASYFIVLLSQCWQYRFYNSDSSYFTSLLVSVWARRYVARYKLLLYTNTCFLLCCCWSIEKRTGWFKRVIDSARPQNQLKGQHTRR